jgi:hypothetical protein
MSMKRISSRRTFYYKRVFPVIWFGFLATFIVAPFFGNSSSHIPSGPFFIVPVVMAVFAYVLLKKIVFDLADEVSDTGGFLVVRFGNAQEQIALANIINISYTMMMNPPRITLTLRQPCRFGKEISFIPPISWVPFSKSPIVAELIERMDAARMGLPAN